MTGEEFSRRRVLQGIGAGAMTTLAGCDFLDDEGDDDDEGCPDVEYDLTTGYDQDDDAAISVDEDDDDWTIVADDAGGTTPRPATVVDDAYWPSPLGDGRWISIEPVFGQYVPPAPTTYEYRYCFCLHEEFSEPRLEMEVLADDHVEDVSLNGNSLSYSGDGDFQDDPLEVSVSDPDYFQAGENCLTIEVRDTYRVVTGLTVAGTVRAVDGDCDCAPCDLSVEKYHEEPFQFGETGTFLVDVCNTGEADCDREAVVRDVLPDQLSVAGYAGSGWDMDTSGANPTFTHDNADGLAPGECLPTLEIEVEVPPMDELGDVDAITNCVALDGNDANPHNDRDCDEVGCVEGDRLFEAGVADEFADGTEPAEPSDALVSATTNPMRDFDETGANKAFGHTFEDLRPPVAGEICEATLEICLAPVDDVLSTNDRLALGIWHDDGTTNAWSRFLGNYDGQDGLFDVTWDAGEAEYRCLELDLSALPEADGSTTSILPLLNGQNKLDVKVQDDTIVDHVTLRVRYCCDDEPGGGGGGECDLSITKDVAGEFHYGQTGHYTLEVCNEGEGTCDGDVVIEDTLPEGMEFQGVRGEDWSASVGGGGVQLTHDAGGLAPGECTSVTLSVAVPSVDAWPGGSDLATNCATVALGGQVHDEDCVEHPITQA